MNIVSTEKRIRKLTRYIARYKDSKKLFDKVQEAERELDGQKRLLIWLKSKLPISSSLA